MKNIKIKIYALFLFLLMSPHIKANMTSEDLQIVDCLLPGKVKQLGLKRTYISKKRPAKITANECAIRGGEFVLEDRASMASSLQVWQESATLGDKEAQYYVGEIYEKGIGQDPEYELARVWYEKSAEQGYAPAKISLGRMYESGLGVDKDLVKAINYYRQASGLEDESIDFVSAFEAQIEQGQKQVASLQSQLEQAKKKQLELTQKVSELQQSLKEQKSRASEIETGVRQTEQALFEARKAVRRMPENKNYKRQAIELNQQLLDANEQLRQQKKLIAAMQSELELARSGEQTDAFLKQQLQQAQNKLENAKQSEIENKKRINSLQNRIDLLKGQLDKLVPIEQMARLEKELQSQKSQMQTALQQEKKNIESQKQYIEELKQELKQSKASENKKVATTRYMLSNAQAKMDEMQRTLDFKNKQVLQLKQEIALLQKTVKQEPTRLDIDSMEAVIQSILSQKEDYIAKSVQNLKSDLAAAKADVSLLQKRLSQKQKMQDDQNKYIDELVSAIANTKNQIEKSNWVIEEKEIQLSAAQERIRSLQSQLRAFPVQVQNLEKQLQLQRDRLAKANSQVSALTSNLAKINTEKTQLQERISMLGVTDAPLITIRWPSSQIKNDTTNASARVIAGSIVNIVGAVYPHKLIESFTINGKEEQLDNSGLFLKPVEVADKPVELTFTAIKSDGVKTNTALTLKPSSQLDNELVQTQLDRPNVDFGKYYALIIHNSNYGDGVNGWQPLVTPRQDAQDLAELLEDKYGFNVEVKSDVTREELLLALENMRKKLTDQDNLLIYYAGHGYIDPENDQGYWIPVDARSDSSVKWVSNASITDQIRAMSARNVMVISDSCYSGSLMRSGLVQLRSGLPVKKRLKRLRDDINAITRVAFSSGGLQPVADSIGNSKNSVFADALISTLKNSDKLLDGQALATEVGVRVATLTAENIKQVPRYAPLVRGGHEGGEFYFVPVEQ